MVNETETKILSVIFYVYILSSILWPKNFNKCLEPFKIAIYLDIDLSQKAVNSIFEITRCIICSNIN